MTSDLFDSAWGVDGADFGRTLAKELKLRGLDVGLELPDIIIADGNVR